MKKLLIALLVIVVLCTAAAVGVGYYVYRQVRSTAAQFGQLAQLPEIERGIKVRGGFVPPASQELTEAQVGRLVRIQSTVRTRIGARFAEFERKYKTLVDKKDATLADAPAVIAAYRDMATVWLDAKRSQVEALNEAGMSLEEYRWIREQAYRALGAQYMELDFSKLAERIQNGLSSSDPAQLRGAIESLGPEINRKLIAPMKKQLEDNLALATFGL